MESTLLTQPGFWALAIVGVFLTGISKSGFAGGAGVVAVPLMALVIPPATAIIIMLPLLLLMDAQTLGYHRRRLSLTELHVVIPAALLGVVLGSWLLSGLPERPLQLVLGALCLLFAVTRRWQPALPASPRTGWLLGGIAGVTSTLIHASGPPLNMYLAARRLARPVWISTAAIFFAAVNFAKLFAYAAIDLWQPELLVISALLIPVGILGSHAGHRLQARISEARFVQAVMICLAGSGVLLLIKGLT